jgi:hypothetical protein
MCESCDLSGANIVMLMQSLSKINLDIVACKQMKLGY